MSIILGACIFPISQMRKLRLEEQLPQVLVPEAEFELRSIQLQILTDRK